MDPIFIQFEQLRNALISFCREIQMSSENSWLANWHSPSGAQTLEDALLDVWYHDDQDGRETRSYPGLIALTNEQLIFANEINFLKNEFHKAIMALKTENDKQWRDTQSALARRFQPLNDSLSRDNLTRLHLKQVYRQLPLVIKRPKKVGFSWYTSGRSIKKISQKDAKTLLEKLNTDAFHVQQQLTRLANLPANEMLARVQMQAPLLRANLVFHENKRKAMNVSLPLFFPQAGENRLPDFSIPSEVKPTTRQRLTRSDNKIEDEAFLPSIRVHRYQSKPARTY